MKKFWRIPALATICWLIGFWAWSAAQVSGQAGPPAAQTPQAQSAAPAKPTGTGKISGQVVAADNGAPVKRVTVMVVGGTPQASSTGRGSGSGTPGASVQVMARGSATGPPPGMVQKQRETDAAGRFEFTDLPAGRFSVVLTGNSSGYGRTQSESVQLDDGGSATVTFRLERTGAITGKVFDETGDPLPRAQLHAMRWESSGGVRRLMTGGSSGFNTTNDLGEYRLWDLPAGEYYVSASAPSSFTSPTVEREDPKFGFAPTFYPGTSSMDGARTVTVRPGQDTPSVDITLLRAKMGRVTATLVDSAGSPLTQRSSVFLTARHDSFQSGAGMMRRPDGTFVSSDLAPGEYYLVANQTQGDGPTTTMSECAVVPVSVNGDDVTVSVQLNKGATVSGKVVVEGKLPEPTPMPPAGSQSSSQARVMVGARSASDPTTLYYPGSAMGRPVPVRDDGTFELTGLRGFVRMMASGSLAVLKSVRKGGQDILATPLELNGSEHITDIEIVVTTETGSIDGTVTDSRGEPATGAYVLIFSDDPMRWFEGSPYVVQKRTSGAGASNVSAPAANAGAGGSPQGPGRITSRQLIPGRYGIVAFESSTSTTLPAYDPEALEKLRSRAIFVTVAAGETATVQLQTVKQ